jgi:hypothetical protein
MVDEELCPKAMQSFLDALMCGSVSQLQDVF